MPLLYKKPTISKFILNSLSTTNWNSFSEICRTVNSHLLQSSCLQPSPAIKQLKYWQRSCGDSAGGCKTQTQLPICIYFGPVHVSDYPDFISISTWFYSIKIMTNLDQHLTQTKKIYKSWLDLTSESPKRVVAILYRWIV